METDLERGKALPIPVTGGERSQAQGGFTLIELLAVMVVLGIVVSIGVAQFDVGSFQSSNERDRLLATIRNQHAEVLRTGAPRQLRIRSSETGVRVVDRTADRNVLDLDHWILDQDRPVLIEITPSKIFLSRELRLRSGDQLASLAFSGLSDPGWTIDDE